MSKKMNVDGIIENLEIVLGFELLNWHDRNCLASQYIKNPTLLHDECVSRLEDCLKEIRQKEIEVKNE